MVPDKIALFVTGFFNPLGKFIWQLLSSHFVAEDMLAVVKMELACPTFCNFMSHKERGLFDLFNLKTFVAFLRTGNCVAFSSSSPNTKPEFSPQRGFCIHLVHDFVQVIKQVTLALVLCMFIKNVVQYPSQCFSLLCVKHTSPRARSLRLSRCSRTQLPLSPTTGYGGQYLWDLESIDIKKNTTFLISLFVPVKRI